MSRGGNGLSELGRCSSVSLKPGGLLRTDTVKEVITMQVGEKFVVSQVCMPDC